MRDALQIILISYYCITGIFLQVVLEAWAPKSFPRTAAEQSHLK